MSKKNNNKKYTQNKRVKRRVIKFLKEFNKLKLICKQLQRDVNSMLFAKDEINNNFIQKLKKSCYNEDKVFVNLYIQLENENNLFEKNTIPTKTPFVEKKVK